MAPLVTALESGEPVVTGDRSPALELLGALPDPARTGPIVDALAERFSATVDGERASALELAPKRLPPSRVGSAARLMIAGQTVYG